jgi:hypothetical protein
MIMMMAEMLVKMQISGMTVLMELRTMLMATGQRNL